MGEADKGSASERTRRQLLEAGWDLLDEVSFADALAGTTAKEIAARAGRSERTFWNHFRDKDSYMEALRSTIPRRGPMEDEEWGPVDVVDEALVGPSREALPDLVRAAAAGNWEEVNRPEELRAFRRQLLLASRSAAHGGLPDVLGHDYYGLYLPRLQAIYQSTGALARVVPLGGFTWSHFTRILAALAEGLQMQSIARQDEVTEGFVTDALSSVALALLATEESGESITGREAAFGVQPAPLEPDPRLVEMALRCRPLVDGELGWPDVADATGLDERTARARFQRLSVVRALAFGSHGEVLGEQATGPGHPPERRVTDLLCALVRAARDDPRCAHALLSERLDPAGDAPVVERLVPLGGAVAAAAGEDCRSVHERMANTSLAAALTDRSAAPADIATAALGAYRGLSAALAAGPRPTVSP